MRKIKYLSLLTIVCFLLTNTCLGQPVTGGLGIRKDKDTTELGQLILKIALLPSDTSKVNLLIQISKRYWYKGSGTNLDTCYTYARRAYELAVTLNDERGKGEAIFMMCRPLTKSGNMQAANDLLPLANGESRIRLLLILAERYVFFQPVDKEYLRKALPYITQSIKLSDSIRSEDWKHEGLLLLGKYYFVLGEFQKGKDALLEIIADCHRAHDLSTEAHYWSEFDRYLPKVDSNYNDHAYYCLMAYTKYLQANLKEDAMYALRDFAVLNIQYNKIDSAERQLSEVYKMGDELKISPTLETCYESAELYLDKGDLNKALSYMIKCVNLVRNETIYHKAVVWVRLGIVYLQLGQYQQCIFYTKKALDAVGTNDDWQEKYFMCFPLVKAWLALGEQKKALEFIQQFVETAPPKSFIAKESIACYFGMIYEEMGQFERAENFFQQMIAFDKGAQEELKTMTIFYNSITSHQVDYIMGAFYVKLKRYREARPYLVKAQTQTHKYQEALDRSNIELLLSKTDSAMGDVRSALKHFMTYTVIKDSLFNIKKSDELEEMLVKYETTQKEQSIRLLQSESKRQHDELEQAGFQRNITLSGIALLLIVSVWAYNAYRVNRHKNRLLEHQQTEISGQNTALQRLVGEKNSLLAVKDMLMKEVHHRVKNNLQIVISLLESQAIRLESDAAQAALLDSQNRVQTISLLHQKLYGSNNVTEVNMEAYVLDLVNYLNHTFNARKNNIIFENSIDPIKLDIGQALPVGMILNEVITNALKYAFPNAESGTIAISLKKFGEESIRLRISDNGIGLPADFQNRATKSLGQTLIKGLSKQLKGRLTIEDGDGVIVTLEFQAEAIQKLGNLPQQEIEREDLAFEK